MLIADLPVRERPRERLAALGTAALADRELLAVLLGTGGSPGVGAHTLAERLLARFGSVTAIARAHPADLASITGVGPAKAAVLVAAFELARRGTVAEAAVTVTGPDDIVTVAGPLLRGRSRERLVVVACDRASRVLGYDVLTEGSADRSLLPIREAVVAVLRRDGKAFALAHNHPSGDPTPSPEDIDATVRVRTAANALGLRFLDHVIVTDSSWRRVTTTRPTTTTEHRPHNLTRNRRVG
jgi:DNA repair protein RadC